MQFSLLINQSKALEWGLNAQQAMLFAFLYEVPSWAKPAEKDGEIYYHLSKGKVADELPLLTDKPDTVYRLMKQLEEKGVLRLTSSGPFTLMAITEQGKSWNRDDSLSRKNLRPSNEPSKDAIPRTKIRPKQPLTSDKSPGYLGEISDLTSDKSPTDHITKSINQSCKYKNFDFSCWPSIPSSDLIDDWFQIRNKLQAPPTQTAIHRMGEKLTQCYEAGFSVELCLSEVILGNWKGLELEWLRNKKIQPDMTNTGKPAVQEKQKAVLTELQEAHAQIQSLERLQQPVPDSLVARQSGLRQQLNALRGEKP